MGARSVKILSTQEANVPLFCQRVNLKLGLTFIAHSCNESRVFTPQILTFWLQALLLALTNHLPSQLYFKKKQLGKCDLHIWELEPTTSKASGLRLGLGPTLDRKATELECRWDLQAGGRQATTSFFFSFTFLCFYLTFPSLSSFSCTSLRDPKSLFSPLIWRWRKGKKGPVSFICWPHNLLLFTHSNQIPFLYPLKGSKLQGDLKRRLPWFTLWHFVLYNIVFTFWNRTPAGYMTFQS